MKTLIAVATETTEASFKTTRLSKSLTHHEENTITTFDLQPTYQNTSGLCAVYNNYLIPENFKKYDCILFVHDDVFIDSINFLVEIRNAFKRGFDVIGVAGGSKLQVRKPCLWHLLCQPHTMSGIVSHYHNNTDYAPTIFGQTPKEVILLDGVFFAIRTKSISEKKVRFDTNLKGFHYYDLKFCLDCHLAGLRLTTAPIHIIHESPGLLNHTEEYSKSEDYFYNALLEHANKRK
jgi:hypothetical protein